MGRAGVAVLSIKGITIDSDAAGTFTFGDSDLFDGVMSGFDGNDGLKLSDVDFGDGAPRYVCPVMVPVRSTPRCRP